MPPIAVPPLVVMPFTVPPLIVDTIHLPMPPSMALSCRPFCPSLTRPSFLCRPLCLPVLSSSPRAAPCYRCAARHRCYANSRPTAPCHSLADVAVLLLCHRAACRRRRATSHRLCRLLPVACRLSPRCPLLLSCRPSLCRPLPLLCRPSPSSCRLSPCCPLPSSCRPSPSLCRPSLSCRLSPLCSLAANRRN